MSDYWGGGTCPCDPTLATHMSKCINRYQDLCVLVKNLSRLDFNLVFAVRPNEGGHLLAQRHVFFLLVQHKCSKFNCDNVMRLIHGVWKFSLTFQCCFA